MAANYVTSAELKASLSLTGQTFADADIDASIASASRAVDQFCGRRFYLDATNTNSRSYSPLGNLVLIDDLVELGPGGVTVDGTTKTQGTDFVFEPVNNPADGKPWTQIRWVAGIASYVGWTVADAAYWAPIRHTITVMGRWGWAAVPPEVKQATQLFATRLLTRQRQAPFGIVGAGADGSAVRIPMVDPDIAVLLTPLSLRQRAA